METVPPTNITVQKSAESTICLLVHVQNVNSSDTSEVFITNDSPGSDYILSPIARSYNANDWEETPGPYKALFSVVDNCQNSGGDWCHMIFDESVDGKFFLMTLTHSLLSFDHHLSRFFQQTTFGPTKEMINDWSYERNEAGMVMWLQNQISLSPTKHRAYFRQHTDSISFNNTPGITSARVQHPCAPLSRWRKYTFPAYLDSQYFKVVSYGDQFVILMDSGFPVTVVNSFSSAQRRGGEPIVSGAGEYEFCKYCMRLCLYLRVCMLLLLLFMLKSS